MVVQGSALNKTELFSGSGTDTTVFCIALEQSGDLELLLEESLNAEIR